jgi:hypothetical protein
MFLSDSGKRFMFEDSEIAIRILNHFMNQNILVLPVHDSFIVSTEHEQDLTTYMIQAFVSRTGKNINTSSSGYSIESIKPISVISYNTNNISSFSSFSSSSTSPEASSISSITDSLFTKPIDFLLTDSLFEIAEPIDFFLTDSLFQEPIKENKMTEEERKEREFFDNLKNKPQPNHVNIFHKSSLNDTTTPPEIQAMMDKKLSEDPHFFDDTDEDEETEEQETEEEEKLRIDKYDRQQKQEEEEHRIHWHNLGIRMNAYMNRDC